MTIKSIIIYKIGGLSRSSYVVITWSFSLIFNENLLLSCIDILFCQIVQVNLFSMCLRDISGPGWSYEGYCFPLGICPYSSFEYYCFLHSISVNIQITSIRNNQPQMKQVICVFFYNNKIKSFITPNRLIPQAVLMITFFLCF